MHNREDSTTRTGGWPSLEYRPEIDGLRAVAVLAVMFYHLKAGLPGGFVGVDVFFVISGYLISGIILRELENRTFSLADFIASRVRRIMPAANAMVLGVLFLGYIFSDHVSWRSTAWSAIFESAAAANCYFWRESGYFNVEASLRPLLHTWSLSVELQFYILFPVVMLVVFRNWPRKQYLLIQAVFAASLLLSLYTTTRFRSATFYLLPARIWELLAGFQICILQTGLQVRGWRAEALSLSGLVLIVCPMLAFSAFTPFPGGAALIPVVGTSMILLGDSSFRTVIGRMLSCSPVVYGGKLSYSLYLWHWPVIAFANQCISEITVVHKVILAVISLTLALASFYWIETPIRTGRILKTRFAIWASCGGSTVVIIALSAWIILRDGFPARFDEAVRVISEDTVWRGTEYAGEAMSTGSRAVVAVAANEPQQGPPDFVIWGDSHGLVATCVLDKAAEELGLSGKSWLGTQAEIIPVTGLWRPMLRTMSSEQLRQSEQVFGEIVESGAKCVIVSCRWTALCDGLTESDLAEIAVSNRYQTLVTDSESDNADLSPAEATAALARQLRKMVRHLENADIQVWLLRQVPDAEDSQIARKALRAALFPSFNQNPVSSVTRDACTKRLANVNQILDSLRSDKVHVVDVTDLCFADDGRLKVADKRPYYRDNDHLTRYGADTFLAPALRKILTELAAQRTREKVMPITSQQGLRPPESEKQPQLPGD